MSGSYEQMKQDYRQHKIDVVQRALAAERSGENLQHESTPSDPTAKRLKEFCIASGHDLRKLDQFMSEIYMDIAFMLAK